MRIVPVPEAPQTIRQNWIPFLTFFFRRIIFYVDENKTVSEANDTVKGEGTAWTLDDGADDRGGPRERRTAAEDMMKRGGVWRSRGEEGEGKYQEEPRMDTTSNRMLGVETHETGGRRREIGDWWWCRGQLQ